MRANNSSPTGTNHRLLALTLLLPLLATPAAIAQVSSYLTSESFIVPFDSTKRLTTQALSPNHTYRITISSDQHNLAGLRWYWVVFTPSTWSVLAPGSSHLGSAHALEVFIDNRPTETGNDTKKVSAVAFLLLGTGHRLAVRSTVPWSSLCVSNCTEMISAVRFTITELPPTPASPVPSKLPSSTSPLLLLLGCVALCGIVALPLYWRVTAYLHSHAPSVRQSQKLARLIHSDTQRLNANTDIAHALNAYLRRIQDLLNK